MAYSLEKEYKKLLSEKMDVESKLATLPDGYISEKTINGTKQYYLQKRIGKRVVGKHISANELSKVRRGLSTRVSCEKMLVTIEDGLHNVEAAAKLVSHDLYKRILLLGACIPMEALDIKQKKRASSFAEAMNAIEGVSATPDVKSGLNSWCSGELSFLALYEATLKKYGFPVAVRESNS